MKSILEFPMKSILESLDLVVKIAIAVAAFFLVGVQKEQAEIEKSAAQSSQIKQEMNLAIVDKLVTLLSGLGQQCITEDRQLFISYLIQVNNAYSKVPFPAEATNVIFTAHKNCGQNLQTVNASNYSTIQPNAAARVAPTSGTNEAPDGYVALGVFSNKTYRNFHTVSPAREDGVVNNGDIVKANWSVYLRTNTDNTESGMNPSLGIIPEGACVKILERRDNVRGQTWAAIKLIEKCG